MTRPRLLDLFCGAGGAAVGYHRAGFDVVGVDLEPQPRYPFEFHRGDALTYPLDGFDAIHASPPCQGYSTSLNLSRAVGRERAEYALLVEPIRARLQAAGVPWVMENVPGAPLVAPIRICGSSFGLPLRRHRLFESNVLLLTLPCAHGLLPAVWPIPVGDPRRRKSDGGEARLSRFVAVYGSTRYRGEDAVRRNAMGIDWMRPHELTQAIPPAYTELIGAQLIRAL